MYCFDTDMLSFMIRPRPHSGLLRKLASIPLEYQTTTAINVGELVYGVSSKPSPQCAQRVLDVIESIARILPFDEEAAWAYADIKADLFRRGIPLDDPDMRIAAIALSHRVTLITGNTRYFDRIDGLEIENWIA